jgi:DNA polymerase-3 subunit alpha
LSTKDTPANNATTTQKNKFVHLHLHTEFSLLDGINRINTLPQYIKDIGQNAVAITDHGNVSGSYRFFKSCRQAGVKPIIGMEAYYTTNDRTVREVDDLGSPYYHLVLLALNNKGLHNLYKLSSYGYTQGMYRKPRIDDALLAEYSEGICATTSCLGSRASQLILNGNTKAAEKLIDHHYAMFDKRLLVELQLHEMEDQQKVNKALLEIAKRKNLPIILTNDCHYTHETDKQLHEAALCMQTGSVLSNEKRFSFGAIDVHTASYEWMSRRAYQANIPESALANTVSLADMVDSNSYFEDRMNRYPKFQELAEGVKSYSHLEILSKQKLFEKFKGMPSKEYRDRLDYELRIIKKMGYSDYMLIVWQFLNGARSLGVAIGAGRGSAGGSLVAYALNITQLDPIKYGLLFERFLNIGRAATPLIFDNNMYDNIEAVVKPTGGCSHSH